MFEITRRYSFDAAHQLLHLPEGHKCRRLHGHTYLVNVTVGSTRVDPRAMVMDFADLDEMIKPLIDKFDHRYIASGTEPILKVLPVDEVADIGCYSTAENLARVIGTELVVKLRYHPVLSSDFEVKVEVFETPKSSASWSWSRA